jgi:hypothetical protein
MCLHSPGMASQHLRHTARTDRGNGSSSALAVWGEWGLTVVIERERAALWTIDAQSVNKVFSEREIPSAKMSMVKCASDCIRPNERTVTAFVSSVRHLGRQMNSW